MHYKNIIDVIIDKEIASYGVAENTLQLPTHIGGSTNLKFDAVILNGWPEIVARLENASDWKSRCQDEAENNLERADLGEFADGPNGIHFKVIAFRLKS